MIGWGRVMQQHKMRRRAPNTPRQPSKYGNKKVEINGHKFDSKKEANYYLYLLSEQQADRVTMFLMQVPIALTASVKYIVDFQVFRADGTVEWIDVKGMRTDMYKLKKRQVEEMYPFEITEA